MTTPIVETQILKPKSDQETISWIRLLRSQNVSRQVFFELINFFGNVDSAIENIANFPLSNRREKPIICPLAKAELEFENCKKFGAQIITLYDQRYPKLLREIPDPPPFITVLGNLDLLNKKTLAIVGSRDASYNSIKFTQIIARQLGEKNFVIASGLARGIDSAAHIASIETGTIAVIAGGIDNIYPPENKDLYKQIAEKGSIISETPFGEKPRGGNFPQRNRIISGLSLGVVVMTASLRSGTLITARLALEQNRELFAVPGFPFDPKYQGTNQLIKQGAKLIENAEDIVSELSIFEETNHQEPKMMEPELPEFIGFSSKLDDQDVNLAKKMILENIGFEPVNIDEIADILSVPAKTINVALIQLELEDKIERKNGKICLNL